MKYDLRKILCFLGFHDWVRDEVTLKRVACRRWYCNK